MAKKLKTKQTETTQTDQTDQGCYAETRVTFRLFVSECNALKALARVYHYSLSTMIGTRMLVDWFETNARRNVEKWQEEKSKAKTTKEKKEIQKQIDYWQVWAETEEEDDLEIAEDNE